MNKCNCLSLEGSSRDASVELSSMPFQNEARFPLACLVLFT